MKEILKSRVVYYVGFTVLYIGFSELFLGFEMAVLLCMGTIIGEQAYREKYGHTKEDVIKAYIEGKTNAGVHSVNEIETWYNEIHNKK